MTRPGNRWSTMLTSWRTALRVSRREARRAKGRSALVVAMIAIPVLGLSFFAATYDMLTLTTAERLDRQLGTADARMTWLDENRITQDANGNPTHYDRPRDRPATAAELAGVLPAGSRITATSEESLEMRTTGERVDLRLLRLDLADPLTTGMATIRRGRTPADNSEIAVSEQALQRLGVTLGGTVVLADGSHEYRVVGVVEVPDHLREIAVLPPPALSEPSTSWLVDTPEPITWEQVLRLNDRGIAVLSRTVALNPPPGIETPFDDRNGRELNVGVLIAGIGALEVVLLAGPAFAVGARRRQRDLALIAAGGGEPAHLRRIVLADGLLLGAVGAGVGLALGVAAAFAGRPLIEEHLFHARAGGYRAFPLAQVAIVGLAILTGLLAALVPAYTAARQDVVAALTGRRGIIRSRRRWLVAGLLLVAAGAALSVYAATRVSEDLILGGLVLVEVGLVLCTPSLIGLLARLGRLLPLAPRIALRDIGRNRAAAAPAISAVMAAVAGTVCLGVYQHSNIARHAAAARPMLPQGYVSVSHEEPNPEKTRVSVDRITALADEHLPTTRVAEINIPACPSGPDSDCELWVRLPDHQQCPVSPKYGIRGDNTLSKADQRRARADRRCKERAGFFYGPIMFDLVDDGTALPLIIGAESEDLARATATLQAGGVVVTNPLLVTDGTVTVGVSTGRPGEAPGSPTESITVPGYALTTGTGVPRTIFSPGVVARAGLGVQQKGFVVATRQPPTAEQKERFSAAVRDLSPDVRVEVQHGWEGPKDPFLLILAVAAGVITLGAAGIATGLTATESRAELSILGSVGASPGVRRRLALSQSGMISGLGTVLGIVAGLGAIMAILTALNQGFAHSWPVQDPYPLEIPWLALGVLAVVPLLAMLGAGLLTRSRLPIERRRLT